MHTKDMFNQALIQLEDKALEMINHSLHRFHLPTSQRAHGASKNSIMLQETKYDVDELEKYVGENEHMLVEDQRIAYKKDWRKSTMVRVALIIFLDPPDVTGKKLSRNFCW